MPSACSVQFCQKTVTGKISDYCCPTIETLFVYYQNVKFLESAKKNLVGIFKHRYIC
jgi:hypothetical protein